MALASLLNDGSSQAADAVSPLAPKRAIFPPRPRASSSCSWPAAQASSNCSTTSQSLNDLHGKPIPDEFIKGKRFAFMDTFSKERPKILGTSASSPGTARAAPGSPSACPTPPASSMTLPSSGHGHRCLQPCPGQALRQHRLAAVWPAEHGRLGDLRHRQRVQDLPGFVVLQSGPRGPRGGAPLWGSGFLPTTYQGVPFRTGGDPILNLSSPPGVTPDRQRQVLDAVKELNECPPRRHRRSGNRHAHRLLRDGLPDADQRPGADRPRAKRIRRRWTSMASNPASRPSPTTACWPAAWSSAASDFVQLYHTDWDHHGSGSENLDDRPRPCLPRDRPGRRRPRQGSQTARPAR